MTETEPDPNKPLRVVGRYALYGKLATGGMATVHFGRLLGPVGFTRTVAIKCLHPQFAKDPEFVAMFLDEARLAARIQHPNVVATLDVVARGDELFLVMDYIRGESFSRLLRAARKRDLKPPEGFIGNVVNGLLHGLHAAHEATDERGRPLDVVHRDVSPQNVLVGTDGVARVLDFGVAKAAARIQVTRDGQMKGKLSYMSPEQLSGRQVDRRSDIFAAGVVLWEALTGQRLFVADSATEVLKKILQEPVPAPSSVNGELRPELDALVLKALERDPDARYQTAREFAIATEEVMALLSAREVGEWVELIAGDSLELREQALAEIEGVSSVSSVSALAGLTPSEPSFMRNLAGSSKTSPLAQWQLTGGRAPNIPAPPRPPGEDDGVTTIYHSSVEAQSRPTSPPLLGDQTQVYDMDLEGEATSPGGSERPSASILGEPRRLLSKVDALRVGALLVAVGLLFLVWSLFSSSPQVPAGEPEAAAVSPAAVATLSDWDKLVEPAQPPSDAPLPDRPEVAEDGSSEQQVLPIEEPGVGSAKRSQESSRVPQAAKSRPQPRVRPPPAPVRRKRTCTQPWFVDSDGIRRIKSECL
jgi:eukaryotic-like serine/threonine-protein kinase